MIYEDKTLREVLDVLAEVRREYNGLIRAIEFAKSLAGVRDGGFTGELSDSLEAFLEATGFLVAQKLLEELTEEQYESLQLGAVDRVEELVDEMYKLQVPQIVAGLAASAITLDALNGTEGQTWNRIVSVIMGKSQDLDDNQC